MNQKRAVGLEDQEANGLGQAGSEASGVQDLAACDEQAHGR